MQVINELQVKTVDAQDQLRVEVCNYVNATLWDEELTGLGGTFFHCFHHVTYESDIPNCRPIFLQAVRGDTLVGMAAGILRTPRLPALSRLCKEVSFSALPATRFGGGQEEAAILAAFEQVLKARGVFRIRVQACDSRNAQNVLSSLGYELRDRYEFHMRLSRDVEENWSALRPCRRTEFRQAVNYRLCVHDAVEREEAQVLFDLSRESLNRRGIHAVASDHETDRLVRHLIKPGRARLAVCRLEGQPLGALLYGVFGGQGCALMAGSSLEGNRKKAMPFLYWEMIRYLTEEKCSALNLGAVSVAAGQDATADGLYKFKNEFGAEAVFQPSGVKTFPGPGSVLDAARSGLKNIGRRMRKVI